MKLLHICAIATTSVLLAGCVSSPETKLASTQYKAAIESYAQNIQAFEDAWVAEINLAIGDLSNALVATAVSRKIQELSNSSDGFSSDEWEREFSTNGLISLATAIDNEHARVGKYLNHLHKFDLSGDEDIDTLTSNAIEAFNAEAIAAVRQNDLLPDNEKSRLLAELAKGPFGDDVVANSLVETILIWRKAADSVPKDLDNLTIVIGALRTAHASVNEWIQTDVTVPGEDVAELVKSWSTAVEGAK